MHLHLPSLLSILLLAPSLHATTTVVPAVPANEASTVIWTSSNYSFDAPKVSPINSTTWTDWYFEAVESPTPGPEQASIVIAFYTATPGGFDLLSGFASEGYTSATLAEAEVTWRNGTTETFIFNATEARITVVVDGASGVFGEDQDTWGSFAGSPDLSFYRVDLQSAGISGSMTMRSVSVPSFIHPHFGINI
jgi:hypothetical protein